MSDWETVEEALHAALRETHDMAAFDALTRLRQREAQLEQRNVEQRDALTVAHNEWRRRAEAAEACIAEEHEVAKGWYTMYAKEQTRVAQLEKALREFGKGNHTDQFGAAFAHHALQP